MGRNPKVAINEDRRKVPISFRCKPEIYQKLILKVTHSGLTVSEYCEKVIAEEATEIKEVSQELVDLNRAKVYFVNKAGNNLNQIARHLNEMRLAGQSDSEKLAYCEKALKDMEADLVFCLKD